MAKVKRLFSDIMTYYTERSAGFQLLLKSALSELFLTVMTNNDKKDREDGLYYYKNIVTMARKYINENYGKKINFEQLAKSFGFSASYFRNLFKQETKLSPIEYLNNIRIENAKAFLREDRYTVSEIGSMCGYGNLQNFSKMFKLKTGFSPSEFQRRHT